MLASVAHQQDGKCETKDRVTDAEIEWCGSQAVMGGNVAGEKSRHAYGKVAGKFIEAHSQTARFGADQIYLHDDGHGPRESLIDAEQRVGGNNPFPTWCPHHHKRHWQSEQPTDNEHALAAPNVGKMARHKIGNRLDDTEANNERDDQRRRGDLKLLRADQRHYGPFKTYHATDEGIDKNE